MENKKDTNALLIGFGLIAVIMMITFFRSDFFSTKKELLSKQQEFETASGQKYQTIDPSQLQQKIVQGKGINLLDIRKFEDYANEHIIDSINVPIEEFPAGPKLTVNLATVIITTDLSDKNIDTALKSLAEEKISDVKVLAGGITAWKKLVGLTVVFGDPKSFVDQAKVSYVELDKLNEAVKDNVPMFILDVRTQEEYTSGHIKGAVNIPFEELEKRRGELKNVPRVVVTGLNELQEFQASVQLYDMILVQPFVLKGGISGWKQKGFELLK